MEPSQCESVPVSLPTQVTEGFDLGLPVINQGGNVEELVMIGPGRVIVSQSLIGGPDISASSHLSRLVTNLLPDTEVQLVELQAGPELPHGLVDVARPAGGRRLARLVRRLPEW